MTRTVIGSMVVSLVLLVGSAVRAQRTPQFAGIWHPFDLAILDTSQDITIRQDSETIAIVEPGNPTTSSVYKLDGSESRNADGISRASWDGEKLVIDTATVEPKRTKIVLSLNVSSTVLAVWPVDAGATQPKVYRRRLGS
jgi:hypothetical protein